MNEKDTVADSVYRPCFSDVGKDWRERWTMLRNFVRSFYSQLDFDKGRKPYQIPDDFPSKIHPVDVWGKPVNSVEQRLDVTLPGSLREWHSLFSQTNSEYFNLLRDDHAMLWSDNGNMLVIRVLCEGNVAWGVRRADLLQDDPTVYEMDVFKYGDSDNSWLGNEWAESGSTRLSVSELLIQNLIWYLAGKASIQVDVPVDADERNNMLAEIGKQSERQSRFGPFVIFESVNCFAAYHVDSPAKNLKVHFAAEPDFASLPAWIVENSTDHRIHAR